MSDLLTFRDLDHDVACLGADTALDDWYESVRDIPLVDLDDQCLARALRQQLFLPSVVPQAIARLEVDPLAGAQYEGELLAALGTIPASFWTDDKIHTHQTKSIVSGLLNSEVDKGVLALAHELVDRLSHWQRSSAPTA